MARLIEKAREKAYILSNMVAFVPHPLFRGMYVKVPACVVTVECKICGSKPGIPCMNRGEYRSFAHSLRKDDGKRIAFSEVTHLAVKYSNPTIQANFERKKGANRGQS